MNRFRPAFLMLLLCASCARTSIDSNVQPGYVFPDSHLLVLQQLSEGPIRQGFQDSFPTYMNSCGVATVNGIIPQASLDTEEDRVKLQQSISNLALQNGASTFLAIVHNSTLVRTVYGTPAGVLSYSFQATLQDNHGHKFWTSIINLKPNELIRGGIYGTNTEDMGKILAHDLVEKLRDDGVLPRCPAILP